MSTSAAAPAVAGAQQNPTPPAAGFRTADTANQQGVPSGRQSLTSRYVVRRGDQVSISFDLATELNQSLLIEPDGYINLKSAPAIHAEGMTVSELNNAVKAAYAPVLSSSSIITVDVSNFLKPFFTVLGQATKPGQYELRADTSVSEGIAVAGGLLPTAKTQILLYHKGSGQWVMADKLNLQDILNRKHLDRDANLQPGDMIFIPEKGITNFRKYVPYSLNLSTYSQQTPY